MTEYKKASIELIQSFSPPSEIAGKTTRAHELGDVTK